MHDNNACISIHYNTRCKYWHRKINIKSNLIGIFLKLLKKKYMFFTLTIILSCTKHIASYTHDNAYNSCVDNRAILIKNAQSIQGVIKCN